ncbi:MAG: IS66 family transposase [Methanomicrobiales archaeon]|jgi:RNA polymerase subunit RPABC4/transcription elongation factor Spt4|nr:IS66 family transposase [Methanomicrobiales archaeon]
MSKNTDSFQTISDENHSLRVLITCLITHYLLIEIELSKLQAENLRISREYEIYRARHPQRVGVKHGKAYELKQLEKEEIVDQSIKTPRKIGAQIGHTKQIRKKCENFDKTVFVNIDHCPDCGSEELSRTQEVRERYVEDIPPQRSFTTRYVIERRYCRNCKRLVEGEVTDALPHARIGLNAMFIVVWLKVGLRLTVSAIPQVLKKICGLTLSEGEVIKICDLISEALGPYYDELISEVRTADARYMDETSWREQGKTIWMWAFVVKGVTLYKIAHSRGHEVPLEVLGPGPNGVDIHDRWAPYNILAQKTGNRPQQLCWFHILGDTKEIAQICGEEGKQFHTDMKCIFKKAKDFNHNGTTEDVEQLIREVEAVLNRNFVSMRCKKFANKILKERDKLFIFVTNPDVDGTNNRAERAVRPNVVLRKVTGGTKSPKGTKNLEVLASAIQTCRMNGTDLVEKGRDLISTSSN